VQPQGLLLCHFWYCASEKERRKRSGPEISWIRQSFEAKGAPQTQSMSDFNRKDARKRSAEHLVEHLCWLLDYTLDQSYHERDESGDKMHSVLFATHSGCI